MRQFPDVFHLKKTALVQIQTGRCFAVLQLQHTYKHGLECRTLFRPLQVQRKKHLSHCFIYTAVQYSMNLLLLNYGSSIALFERNNSFFSTGMSGKQTGHRTRRTL
jgi:hypothetical protein